MDSKSRLLFAEILLDKADFDPENVKWGVSPDIDYSKEDMIHRISLHTLNRLNKIEEGI